MILRKDISNLNENQQQEPRILEVGKVDEVPIGEMKYVEVQGKEIVISNIGGKFYAMDDRCGHMNARLSTGNISKDGIVTCPFHGARFDATTEVKQEEVILMNEVLIPPPNMVINHHPIENGTIHCASASSLSINEPSYRHPSFRVDKE